MLMTACIDAASHQHHKQNNITLNEPSAWSQTALIETINMVRTIHVHVQCMFYVFRVLTCSSLSPTSSPSSSSSTSSPSTATRVSHFVSKKGQSRRFEVKDWQCNIGNQKIAMQKANLNKWATGGCKQVDSISSLQMGAFHFFLFSPLPPSFLSWN